MTSRILPQIARAAARHSTAYNSVVFRGFLSCTSPVLEIKTINVPTMGDSITEGTIVEWPVQIGQMVKEGDVIALVETDKVTVDIKADIDGVITKLFGEVDDTVEVGAPLYELDTEGVATVEASASSTSAASSTPAAAAPPAAAPAKPAKATAPAKIATVPTNAPHRVPSIKFLGKEGWYRVLHGIPEFPPVPVSYGRPKFSEEEMEALLSGGATLAPDVKKFSSGAMFAF